MTSDERKAMGELMEALQNALTVIGEKLQSLVTAVEHLENGTERLRVILVDDGLPRTDEVKEEDRGDPYNWESGT